MVSGAMLKYLNVRIYCAGVFLAGCVVIAGLASSMDFRYLEQQPLTFAALFIGVMLGELMPVKIPRRGGDEEITLSTSFSMALMLAGGLAPALIAQLTASVVQDRTSGKPSWRVRFNVGQYTLSMAGAWSVMRILNAAPHVGTAHPFSSADLPGDDRRRGSLLLGQHDGRWDRRVAVSGRPSRQVLLETTRSSCSSPAS